MYFDMCILIYIYIGVCVFVFIHQYGHSFIILSSLDWILVTDFSGETSQQKLHPIESLNPAA